MILMQIPTIVGKNQIGLKTLSHGLKEFLDRLPFVRKKTVTKIPDDDARTNRGSKKQAGCGKSLAFAGRTRAENHPVEVKLAVLPQQSQDRSAASDFDVVAMGAEAENVADPAVRIEKAQLIHAARERAFAFPCANRSHCRGWTAKLREEPSTIPKGHSQRQGGFRASAGP